MLKALNKNIIVKMIEKNTTTESGIILTRVDASEANKAKVLSVGDLVNEVSVDDVILINWNKAIKNKDENGSDIYVVSEDDVVLIFEE